MNFLFPYVFLNHKDWGFIYKYSSLYNTISLVVVASTILGLFHFVFFSVSLILGSTGNRHSLCLKCTLGCVCVCVCVFGIGGERTLVLVCSIYFFKILVMMNQIQSNSTLVVFVVFLSRFASTFNMKDLYNNLLIWVWTISTVVDVLKF